MVLRSMIVTKMLPCKLRWRVLMVLEDKYFRGFETYAWCVKHMCLQSDSLKVPASDPLTVLSTVPGSPL